MAVAKSTSRPSPLAPLPLRWEREAHQRAIAPPLLPQRERGWRGEGRLCNRHSTAVQPGASKIWYHSRSYGRHDEATETISGLHDFMAQLSRVSVRPTSRPPHFPTHHIQCGRPLDGNNIDARSAKEKGYSNVGYSTGAQRDR